MTDEERIIQLFEDGDRALMAGDLAELSRIFAADYIQCDEAGKAYTKQDVLNNLRTGAIRYISMTSTGRDVRMLNDLVAVVHGSEDDEIEQDGRRFAVRYLYKDTVVKRNGEWQIMKSELTKPKPM